MLSQTWLVGAFLLVGLSRKQRESHLAADPAFAGSREADLPVGTHADMLILMLDASTSPVAVALRGEASMGMPAAHTWAA